MEIHYLNANQLCSKIQKITNQNNVFFNGGFHNPIGIDLSIIKKRKILLVYLIDIINNSNEYWEKINKDAIIYNKEIYVLTDSILDLETFSFGIVFLLMNFGKSLLGYNK